MKKRSVLKKFKKFLENHGELVYFNDDIEFCFCQDLSCENCILITDCANDPISHMPPFISQSEFKDFKLKYPEFFI